MRLEGWGLRTPYGIGFDPFDPDLLCVSNNGADVRQKLVNGKLTVDGSRHIDNDYDDMFVIDLRRDRPQFFGHPDYFHDPVTRQPLPVTNPLFCPAGVTMRPLLRPRQSWSSMPSCRATSTRVRKASGVPEAITPRPTRSISI